MSDFTARAWAIAREFKALAVAFLIFLLVRIFIFQPFTIPSDSEEPTLKIGDYVIVSKSSYGWSRHSFPLSLAPFSGRILGREPRRGDVIVFKLPRDGRTDYVKRLIGLPGDRIQLIHGVVFLNGAPLRQDVIGPTTDPDVPERAVIALKETLPDGRSHVILREPTEREGDTTDVYRVPEGQYFFLGDNRDNSLDSRWPRSEGVGFVPAENLEGRAVLIAFSWRGGASLWKPWTWVSRFDPGRMFHPVK
jgi:signal peptidase I